MKSAFVYYPHPPCQTSQVKTPLAVATAGKFPTQFLRGCIRLAAVFVWPRNRTKLKRGVRARRDVLPPSFQICGAPKTCPKVTAESTASGRSETREEQGDPVALKSNEPFGKMGKRKDSQAAAGGKGGSPSDTNKCFLWSVQRSAGWTSSGERREKQGRRSEVNGGAAVKQQ